MIIRTPILPTKHQYAKIDLPHDLHLEAICIFVATGFFLGEDTYFKNQVCLSPATKHTLDSNGFRIKSDPHFKWHYTPRSININSVLEEYMHLLNNIVKEKTESKQVILPLSGGLDSRSLALSLKGVDNEVNAISYSFKGGYPEDKIASKIAAECNFGFESFTIGEGYLWEKIEAAAKINQCYSEFTNPRQIAVLDNLRHTGDLFLLGHWGDVLFDRGVASEDEGKLAEELVYKKIVKPKGLELASLLWKNWGLKGSFGDYIRARIKTELDTINIDCISAKVRAFKTKHWAHRWTTTNMSFFGHYHDVAVPFYDDRMCEFICTVPENILADRRLQIAHLKTDKALASITWQRHRPFSIMDFHNDRIPYNLPFRINNKLKREWNKRFGYHYVQRNWELQFLGAENERHLLNYLKSKELIEQIDEQIINDMYLGFKTKDAINYAHPVSMLLTLSICFKQFYNK